MNTNEHESGQKDLQFQGAESFPRFSAFPVLRRLRKGERTMLWFDPFEVVVAFQVIALRA